MTSPPEKPPDKPPWTAAAFMLGVQMAIPAMPGMVAFGLAVGATAARKGLTLVDSVLMNIIVFAGAAQFVALEVWPERFSIAAIAALALLVGTVNARILLVTASLHPWLGGSPTWQVYPTLYITTDSSWLITMRYRSEGGSDAGVLLGSSVVLALAWIAASTAGYLGGALAGDTKKFGLDLVMPVFFTAMLVPLWRGAWRAIPWVFAGAVALVVRYLLDGWLFIFAGAIAGCVLGGLINDDD
jgi:predicted branched-subunit amino acid permease